ncbi:uncharacterized protein LOC111328409 [Stylophora pistillata]|nr:uncharacterized protein LOC111328409 [Stylophora pistillata]
MKNNCLFHFALIILISATVESKHIVGKHGHQSKRLQIPHRPVKPNLTSRNKKHEIVTLAAPPSIGALLPSAHHMTLMPNGVPTEFGGYIHHLLHRHLLDIPVYHGYHGVYPVHLPQHYEPIGLIGHRLFYRHGPPFLHRFVHSPWPRPLRRTLGYKYDSRFGHSLWHGSHVGHNIPAGYGFGYNGYGYRGFQPLRGWYPYSFDHSVDLRGDSGPTTMFVERSSIPTSKRTGQGRKVDVRRLLKTWRNLILTKRIPFAFPLSRSKFRYPLSRKLLPFGLRIQRFKMSLAPLKRMLKHSKTYNNLMIHDKKKKGKPTVRKG